MRTSVSAADVHRRMKVGVSADIAHAEVPERAAHILGYTDDEPGRRLLQAHLPVVARAALELGDVFRVGAANAGSPRQEARDILRGEASEPRAETGGVRGDVA